MKLQDKHFLKPSVQLFFLIGSIVICTVFALYRLTNSASLDPQPRVLVLKVQDSAGEQPAPVHVGFSLNNFLNFDVINNNFIVDATVWFTFDKTRVTLEDIEQFSFSKGEIVQKSGPFIQQSADGALTARYEIRLEFASNLIYRFFPLDNHSLYITLNNKAVTTSTIIFNSDNASFITPDTLYTFGWGSKNKQVVTGASSIIIANEKLIFPRVVFALDFVQTSMRQFIFIMLPLFVIFFLTIFAFALSLRKDFSTIIGIAGASVAALVSYRFVIEKISPPRITYFMLSDHLFALFLLLLFVIVFIDIFYRDTVEKHRGFIVFLFYTILITAWTYLLFFW